MIWRFIVDCWEALWGFIDEYLIDDAPSIAIHLDEGCDLLVEIVETEL